MKKTYTAPIMEREMFETSDIITASVEFNAMTYDVQNGNDTGIPTVNAGDLTYN